MAASGSSLRFSVEVAADEAQKTLKAMSLAFSESGTQARIAMSQVKPSSDGAGKATESLFGKLKDLRGETRQHEKLFGFYGKRLADVTGLTKGLGIEVASLGIALGSGMWVAAAVAAIKLVADEFERQHEWQKKIKEINEEIVRDQAAGWQRIHDSLVPATASMKAYRDEFDKHGEAVKAAQKELSEYRDGFKGLAYWYNLNSDYVDGLTARTEALTRAQAIQRNQADIMSALAEEQARKASALGGDKLTANDQQAAKDIDLRRRMLTLSTEVAKLEAEAANARLKGLAQEEAATRRLYAERLRIARIHSQFSTPTATEDDGQDRSQSLDDLEKKRKHDEFVKQLEDQKKKKEEEARAFAQAEREKERAADQFSAAAARELTAVIDGQKTLGQVMQDIERQILQTLLQAAIKKITMSALTAGAEAFESQAGIPIVGPAMGAGAMGATVASVLGLLGSLPSAAKGWSNTGSYEGLMWVHQREAVLDEQTAEDWRRGRGGGSGAPLIGTVIATDAESFGRQLQQRDSDLVKGLGIAARRRRLSRV